MVDESCGREGSWRGSVHTIAWRFCGARRYGELMFFAWISLYNIIVIHSGVPKRLVSRLQARLSHRIFSRH